MPFLTAEWRSLLMLNYPVEPALLAGRVPPGTELDRWEGQTFISIVGFLFLRTRVLGVPIPGHMNFEEVNLRFYVRRETPEEVRRGVVFVKEIVPRRAIAAVARWIYNEPYVARPMSSVWQPPAATQPGRVEYGWRSPSGSQNRVGGSLAGEPQPLEPGSEAEFITEHYWGYGVSHRGRTLEYQVEHPPWKVWTAVDSQFECAVEEVYGPEFVPALQGPPSSAFIAEGSPISVYPARRLPL